MITLNSDEVRHVILTVPFNGWYILMLLSGRRPVVIIPNKCILRLKTIYEILYWFFIFLKLIFSNSRVFLFLLQSICLASKLRLLTFLYCFLGDNLFLVCIHRDMKGREILLMRGTVRDLLYCQMVICTMVSTGMVKGMAKDYMFFAMVLDIMAITGTV